MQVEDDEDKGALIQLNFKEGEGFVGKVPFNHWIINRSIIQSHTQSLAKEGPTEAKLMLKETIRDLLTKNLDLETLFAWLINYNPIMVQTGLTWDSKTIKDVVFY